MSQDPKCPKCQCEFTYPSDSLYVCSECFHEWNPEEIEPEGGGLKVLDSNGNELNDGDNVSLIKDLKVKGANITLKRGSVIKGIRLTDNPGEVDCRHQKIKGLVLRTEFLKKA